MNKDELFRSGLDVGATFCRINQLPQPSVRQVPTSEWSFGVCAYYRAASISICVPKCAAIGTAGRSWSFPGYTVDRTPYGVIQHELGHHVDVLKGQPHRRGAYWSDFSAVVRGFSGDKPITSYCPNDAEWFAEMFRVFVTNPDLLKAVRPRTYAQMLRAGLHPVFTDNWRDRLAGAPARTITAAERHIEAALA